LLEANSHLTVAQFALKFGGRKDLVELFDCYQRAPKKYPTWHGTGLLYTRTALEQSSGEAAALFKASLLGGGLLIDLTGGLGIDTFAFSRRFKDVLHIERDAALSDIARHNHHVMGADNVRYLLGDATVLLPGLPSADAAFIDPSRRDAKGRLVRLQDCEPDLTTLAPALLERIPTVLAKLSPLFDLHEIPRQLSHVADIHVVSVAGEVKEILVRMVRGFAGEPTVHAVGLSANGAQKFMVSGPLQPVRPPPVFRLWSARRKARAPAASCFCPMPRCSKPASRARRSPPPSSAPSTRTACSASLPKLRSTSPAVRFHSAGWLSGNPRTSPNASDRRASAERRS
jgi:hypothetical protein